MPVKKTVGGSRREEKPAKSGGKKAAAAHEEGGSGESRADAFDNVKAQGSVDPGKYEAVIEEFVLQDADDEKGQSARIKYGIASAGDFRGVQVTQFYKVFEANGDTGKGAAFLKKDLAVLGYGEVKFADLEEAFEEIVEKDMGVLITVKQNGQFTNCYLGGLAEESDVIAEYLDQRTF